MSYSYDVFISHSAADRSWVAGWLVPRLEAAGLTVAVGYRDFLPGVPLLDAIEQIVAASRHALVIVTPDWTTDEWNAYEARLTHTFDPAGRRRKLIPVRLRPCAPPDCLLPRAIADLVMADFTDERQRNAELARLMRALRPITPPPTPGTIRPGLPRRRWLAWWLSYHRGRILGGTLVALLLLLTLSALIGRPTFPGWRGLSPAIPQAWRLHRAGDVLLVSTRTDAGGCAVAGEGLWRSTDGGRTWQAVDAPLRSSVPGQPCIAAAIADFAHAAAAPQTIYAATTNAGLLRSDDGGHRWTRADQEPLPAALTHVAVSPTDERLVWAAGAQGGLFRSADGGATWARVDGTGACAADGRPLPAGFTVGALLATDDALYAGSWLDTPKAGAYPGPEAGLYVSRDGGLCWRQVDSAEGRYGYVGLAQVGGRPGQLLVLLYSYQAVEAGYPYELWLLMPGAGRIRRVWASCSTAAGLFAGPGEASWSVATDIGRVLTGRVDASAGGDATPCESILATLAGRDTIGGTPLPPVRRCTLPPRCYSDLAADAPGAAPLLLMGDRVYRLDRIPWPQALWP